MPRAALAIVLLLSAHALSAGEAKIFRWVDDDGTVHFSNQPQPPSTGAQPVEDLPELTTVPAVEAPPNFPRDDAASNQGDPQQAYKRFAVVEPQPGAALRDNAGNVSVVLQLSPGLKTRAGDRVHLFMDGEEVARGSNTRFQLTGRNRGTHALYAEVKNRAGDTVIATDSTSFTLKRHSTLQ